MSCTEFFNNAVEYAQQAVNLPNDWRRDTNSWSTLIGMKLSDGNGVFVANVRNSTDRLILIHTEIGNAIIEQRTITDIKVYFIHLPLAIAALLDIPSGSVLNNVDTFRLFYDPLFKRTIHTRLKAVYKALEAVTTKTPTETTP